MKIMVSVVILVASPALAASDDVPTILVVPTTPVLGSGLDAAKVPNTLRLLRGRDVDAPASTSPLAGALDERVGSVATEGAAGSESQPNVLFRGFEASPVQGTPQGLAVYQDGVRLNEAFGDTVNWDLVPAFAIDSVELTSTNPVYGYNALGGGLALAMKDGATFSGTEVEAEGGSFGRRAATIELGRRWDDASLYLGAAAEDEAGWRRDMPTSLRQVYGDVGVGDVHRSLHLSFTGADNHLAGAGPTPEPLLATDRRAGFTYPQDVHDRLRFVAARGQREISRVLSLQATAYVRDFHQTLADGNPSPGLGPCDDDPSRLCGGDDEGATPLTTRDGGPVPIAAGGAAPGVIDHAATSTRGVGGAVQATLVGSGHHFVVGASVDQGRTSFRTDDEVGAFDDQGHLTGSGIDAQGGELGSLAMTATNIYGGVYLTETLDVTESLAVTVAARLNTARIELRDDLGGDLGGSHRYERLNPAAGFALRVAPGTTWFANYAESNRVPTAAELTCADPQQSCSLASFFVADPDLKQVVARTVETGLRGRGRPSAGARLDWSLALFRTVDQDDLIEVASATPGKGYFRNAGDTRRQGAEASLALTLPATRASLDYGFVDATFGSSFELNSPDNPAADASGSIHVEKGDHLPGIPRQQLKATLDHDVLPPWSVGGSFRAVGARFLQGDEGNDASPLGAYTLLDLRSSYRLTATTSLWLTITNALNRQYETYGSFTDGSGVPLAAVPGGIGKTRTVTPGAPRGFFAGARVAF